MTVQIGAREGPAVMVDQIKIRQLTPWRDEIPAGQWGERAPLMMPEQGGAEADSPDQTQQDGRKPFRAIEHAAIIP
jgi:hypothetical protein